MDDPFIGKERSAQVWKICFTKSELNKPEKIIMKTRFIKIQIYKNTKNEIELSYRFLFKRYFQNLVKEKKKDEN